MIRLLLLPLLVAAGVSPLPAAQGVVAPWLETALRQARPGDRHAVWIYFRDKGLRAKDGIVAVPPALSARARARRIARGNAKATALLEDLPVDRGYVEQTSRHVARLRHTSRWLNAVSAEATDAQIQAVAALPFVARVDLVKRYRRREEPIVPIDRDDPAPRQGTTPKTRQLALDYGTSLEQLAQMRVPELHDRGLDGTGVVVAVFDSGFPNLEHEALVNLNVIAEHDFVNGLENVRASTHDHGLATLSALAGRRDGELYGPAYGASFILAVTEDARSETPIEEDNWAAAAEWAEALGADVISSSLGYLVFDLPYTSYTERDMDGATAVTTRAAEMAAARGVVVVNSAGNGGFRMDRNTLGAPADGRQVIAVGAVDALGVRADFSSVGPTSDGRIKPDVVALGVRAKVASATGVNRYARANGTSFSCPLVAGVLALLLQAHPTYTVEQVRLALQSTAHQAATPDNLLGWGIIDAVRAVDAAVPPATVTARQESFCLAGCPR